MDIQEFRAQFPQYDDLSDEDLAESLYQKHYADMPRNEFEDSFRPLAKAEKTAPTTESSLAHYGTQFAKGVVQPAVSLFKKAALDQTPLLEGLQKQEAEQGIPMPKYLKGVKKPEDIGFFKAGQAIEAQTDKLPEKPELQGSFGSDVARGIGSSVGFLATGAAMSPVTGFFPGAAIAGAASGGVESYEDAIKHGKTPDEAMDTWAYNIGSTVGLSEVAPIGALFKSLDRVSGGRLKKVLIGAGIEAASEAMQEMFQTGAGNAVAKYYYDQDREYWDNVARSGGVAAVVGGLVGGGIGAVRSGTSKSRITPEDFSTTPTQPTELEVNDAAWQRFQEQQRQQGLQTPEGRQREIDRIWEQENPQEATAQTAPTTEAPVATPAPVYSGPTQTASLKAELRAPEVPNIQEPAANAPSMIRSPVHEVLAIQPSDRVQAEWLAEVYSKELGRTFHVWETPNGPRLRLAPQKQELGLEYEQWVDELEASQEQEPTSPEAMRQLRADVAANRAAEEYTPAQPEDLKNKILGYNKFNEPVYQWQVDEAQVKMMKGEEIDRERITAVSAEPQTESSVINSQRLGYTEQDRLAGRATPEVKADRTQDILGQPSGRVEVPTEMEAEAEAEADPIIEGAPKTLMGKKLYLKRLGPAARNYEVSNSGEIVKLYTFGPQMFKKLWRSRLQDAVALDIKNWPKMIAPGNVDKKLRAMTTNNDPRRSFKMEEWEDMQRMGGMQEWLAGWGEEKIPREKLLEEIQSRGIQVSEVFYPSAEVGKMAADNKRAAEQILQDHAEQIRTVERGTGEEWLDPARLPMDVYGRYSQLMDAALSGSSTKHSQWTLPGGTNYIELVLTSPQAQKMDSDPTHFVEGEGRKQIGWIRGKEFTDSQGRRVFHIEEVQSNRHQAGRKSGYGYEKSDAAQDRYRDLFFSLQDKYQTDYDGLFDVATPEELAELRNRYAVWQEYRGAGTPDAPFRKSWPTLLLRRALKYAAQNGYDVVSWTTGEQEHAKYSGESEAGYKAHRDQYGSMSEEAQYTPGWLMNNMKDAAKPFKVREELLRGGEYSLDYLNKEIAAVQKSLRQEPSRFGQENLQELITARDALVSMQPVPDPQAFSVQPAITITPEMQDHYANNPMYLYSFGPQMFKNFFSGFEKMPGGGLGTRSWKFLERKALLPYQVMKTKVGGKQIYNTAAQQREDTVGPTINMLLPVKTAWQQLSKEEQAEAIQTVKDIEGKKLAATPSNEILTNADGFVELVPEHLKEFEAFLKNKGFSQPVQDYLLARKKMYNEAFAHKYNTLKNSGRANPTELQDMLQHEGFIPNYFPHNWYGKTYIPGYDADGNLVARVSVGRITEGVGKVLGGAPGIKTLRKELETSKVWQDKGVVKWGDLTDASENERYWINAPIPVDAIGRVLDEGAAKLAENPEYEKLAEGFRRALMKDTINILKSQGFPHYAKRKGILGYEQNDLMGVDFDYIHGLNASLAKMKAAKEFTKLLVETKTDKSDHQLYADFVEDVLGHENSSVDKLSDNIRFVLFMRYLGGSIRSGLINLSAIPAVSTPFLSRISTHSGRLHADAAASVVGKTRISGPEQRFLGEFSDTLFQAQQMNEFRSRQERTGGTHRLSNWAGKIMEVTESFMRKTTGLATMRAIAEGRIVDQKILEENGWKRGEKVALSNEENYQKAAVVAGEMVSDVHMDYTRYNKPQIVRRSPALRTMYTFRGYNQHLMQAYINMLKEEGPRGKAAAAASMGMQMALGGVGANMVISALLGAYDWMAKESAETSLREAFPNQETALDAAFMGFPSLAGMHLGGSFESGIPTSIKEAVGVPFAAWEEVERGYTAWVNGNRRKAVEIMIPFKSMANVLSAYREATQGIRTNTGAPVYKPGTAEQMVLEPHEALLQAAGIRPTSKEKAWRASSEIQDIGKYKKEAQGRLASRYTNAIVEEQWDEAEGVLDEIMAWNMTWASKGREELMISMESLRSAIKARTLPRKEPKQMRGKAQRIGEAYSGQ